LAVSAAKITSHIGARVAPSPTAWPFIRQITGRGHVSQLLLPTGISL